MTSALLPRLDRFYRLCALALVLPALGMSVAGPKPGALAEGGTGKVPVEGALTANNLSPRPGDVVYVYFNATALSLPTNLQLQIQPPEGVEIVGGGNLTKTFAIPGSGESVALSLIVRITTPGEKKFLATATLHASADFVESRTFALVLNGKNASNRATSPAATNPESAGQVN